MSGRADDGDPEFDPGFDPGFDFGAAVLDLVAQIPSGRVMTYGAIAAVLGSRAARAVGRIMQQTGGTGAHWWRVVNVKGMLPLPLWVEAYPRYLAEGTPLATTRDGGATHVDMKLAVWDPITPD